MVVNLGFILEQRSCGSLVPRPRADRCTAPHQTAAVAAATELHLSRTRGRGEGSQLICPSGCFSRRLSSPFEKNILIFRKRKSPYIRSRPVPLEGRCATSRNAERDAVDAGCALDGRCGWRTAKPCGPDAPTLASSSREASFLGGDGGKKARSPGRARSKPKTTARGMPGDSGVT